MADDKRPELDDEADADRHTWTEGDLHVGEAPATEDGEEE